jgi:phosphocarrier protein FPr
MDEHSKGGGAPAEPTLALKAPLSGPLVPIDRVPDPVFAHRLLGDGVAVDPVSAVLLAPCDGVVATIHPAGHAIALTTDSGVEVMLHIGLDTVALGGRGFVPRVAQGRRVAAGEPLVAFDADMVARSARSLVTPVVITSRERVTSMKIASGFVTAGVDDILVLTLVPSPAAPSGPAPVEKVRDVRVLRRLGLHARPAAALAGAARRFRAEVLVETGSSLASARSIVGLLSLGVVHGEVVRLRATGPDAGKALAALARVLEAADGNEPAAPLSSAPRPARHEARVFMGVPAAPGCAAGPVARLLREEPDVPERGEDERTERRVLDSALEEGKVQLRALEARLGAEAGGEHADIFEAHVALLEDPLLLAEAEHEIAAGKGAAWAFREAVHRYAERISRLPNPALAARAADLRDAGSRVLRILAGQRSTSPPPAEGSIVVAEDISPSEVATLGRGGVAGFCTVSGGATSHAALLARSMGIPAVTGLEARALEVADGTPAILDGDAGELRLSPGDGEREAIRERCARREARRTADRLASMEPAFTRDGARIAVLANAGSLADAEEGMASGAEGIGLLRSELLFVDRANVPSEDEQEAVYRAVAEAVGPGKPIVVRTFDAGGDKPLRWLPLPEEENPALGERGLRVFLDRPDLFRAQLRALLRVPGTYDVRVTFPMVATLDEWREAVSDLEEERDRLGAPRRLAGMTVEVASAAILAEAFLREAGFVTIGTNDLTQFTLAMDRGHPRLSHRADALDPAVLHLIARTCAAARKVGIPSAVCGALAGDLTAVPLLLGLGVGELSVGAAQAPSVKARVREVSLDACRTLAVRALEATTAAEVRTLLGQAGGAA